MSPHLSRRSLLLTALAILFFCSGVCALIYQVLWLRMLGWVFGVTVYAASAVWATFMADRPLTEYFLSLPRNRDPISRLLKGDVRPYVVPG